MGDQASRSARAAILTCKCFERQSFCTRPQTFRTPRGGLGREGEGELNARLVFDGSDHSTANATVISESGRNDLYARQPDLSYTAPQGVFDRLTLNSGDGSFTLRRKDRSQLRFDCNGVLLSLADRDANTTPLTYSAGPLTTVTAPDGRTLGFSYDGSGRIALITDPIARTITFSY